MKGSAQMAKAGETSLADETSLTDDLRAAIEAAGSDEGEAPDPTAAAAEGAAAEGAAAAAEAPAGGEVEPDAAAATDKPAGEDPRVKPEDDNSKPDSAAAGGVTPPAHWSAEDKAFFAGLPDDAVRKGVLDWRKSIERAADGKFEAAAEARRDVGEIDRLLQPILGPSPRATDRAEAIRVLVGAEQMLRSDPLGGIARLVQNYARSHAGSGQAREMVRSLSKALEVGDGAPETGQAESQDPVMARVTALEHQLSEERRQRADAEAQQLQQVIRKSDDAIKAFAEERSAEGQLAHPHFEQVRSLMGALMQDATAAGKPMTLKEAYQSAVWAQPGLRDELVKAHATADARLAAERDQAALQRARQASTPRTASTVAEEPEDDLPVTDLLRRELTRGAGGRV